MNYLFVLRGAPGAGKSTFIKYNCLENYTISVDNVRSLLRSPIYNIYGDIKLDTGIDGRVWKLVNKLLDYRMDNGDTTFIDATCSSIEKLNEYRKICKKYNYRLNIIDFTDIPIDIIKKQNNQRNICKIVPDSCIDKMCEQIKNNPFPKSIRVINKNDFISYAEKIYDYIDISNIYKKIFAIGDIHGCYTALQSLLNKYKLDPNKDKDTLFIFVGDYFDRGIENSKVFNYLNSIIDLPNVKMLIGNHENNIIKYLRGDSSGKIQFMKYTHQEFLKNGITDKLLSRFIKKLDIAGKYIMNGQKYLFTHAGMPNPKVNVYTSNDSIIYGAGKYEDIDIVTNSFLNKNSNNDVIQVFGHRNPYHVPIYMKAKNYNLCGFPEDGLELRGLEIKNNNLITNISPVYVYNYVYSLDQWVKAYKEHSGLFDDSLMNTERFIKICAKDKLINVKKCNGIKSDSIFSYNFSQEAFHKGNWNGVSMKARGMFVNTNNNTIVARSYDKFFQYKERKETTFSYINKTYKYPLYIYKKYNGYLGILSYDKESDEILILSKSLSDSDYANNFKKLLNITNEEKLKSFFMKNNVSITFEICDTKFENEQDTNHIIEYDKPILYLLDFVNNSIIFSKNENEKFNELLYEVKQCIDFSNIKVKELYKVLNEKITEKYIDILIRKNTNIEGFVITDSSNTPKMFKLKTIYYQFWKIVRTYAYAKKIICKDIDITSNSSIKNLNKYEKESLIDILHELCNITNMINDKDYSLMNKKDYDNLFILRKFLLKRCNIPQPYIRGE